MVRSTRRRELLALVAASLAGCQASQDAPTGTPTPATSTEAAASTPTASPTPAGTETPAETETPTPTATETPTETPTPATPAEERAAAALSDADAAFGEAVAAYVANARGEDPGFGDVTAEVLVDVPAVREHLGTAREALSEAREYATGQQDSRVAALEHLVEFLDTVTLGSAASYRAHRPTRRAATAAIEEDPAGVEDAVSEAENSRRGLGDRVEALEADSWAGSTIATDHLARSQYTAKRQQLALEHRSAAAIATGARAYVDALPDLRTGTDAWLAANFEDAEAPFDAVATALSEPASTLAFDPPAAYDRPLGRIGCLVNGIQTTATELAEGATKQRNFREEHEAAALEALRGCSAVPDSSTANRLRSGLAD